MISLLKEDGKITVPLVCIMTDYAPHRAWIHPYVDSYIVSNEGMVDTMAKMGAPRQKIHPYGIPVDESFYEKMDRDAVLKQMGLSPDKPPFNYGGKLRRFQYIENLQQYHQG